MKKLPLFIPLALAVTLMTAHGDFTVTDGITDSDILNTGVVQAVNFYDAGSGDMPSAQEITSTTNADPTVNGVTFTGVTYTSGTAPVTPGFSITNIGGTDDARNGGVPDTDALFGLVYTGLFGANMDLTLNDLVSGDTYSLQLVFDSYDGDATTDRGNTVTDNSSDVTSDQVATGPNLGAGSITDTFTVTGVGTTTHSVTIVGGSFPSEFSGFVLSNTTVPEPSTWALLLGGAAALASFQVLRRKQA
jgi:hypothetical protein